ncbi:nicotinate phosphoribosyltransferase Npt1 [Schizosaccharomyces pombe]|uniref:Probable nicotinate phosphoribosyltransferase n=1 Tax=Schizosaccharomyces pombe (strain 972 / ATCC 24843) TaxID=284812 RepID=NPT1_SCHPO|nr:putative nicotinate phosphoribosyltransferase [Schizosaccharomyces pombe]Q9UTK3.1 RecName: Full=Probable nicotinate phosphoribosyltransferase; Short=NAPRTase [Schizosaccharomyces pombe 972h-]CAB62416.1 nicotinate phosphoribosyltransferase (predicted) [Schizosaccharomyces pombe]|eukprot:NP_001342932.1 putative nicotinate phosphoribosyltransferase [Schizosaccharomyces pombe]
MSEPAVVSILDTDLYKLTMLQAVLEHYPDAQVSYKYTNRSPKMALNQEAYNWLREQIRGLRNLHLLPEEEQWLRKNCPYLKESFYEFMHEFEFDPENSISLNYDSETKDLSIFIHGLWKNTIFYEIPLLALVSESYFKFVDKDWSPEGQFEKAYEKGKRLIRAGCAFTDFGTRRRRDPHTQEIVLQGLMKAQEDFKGPGSFLGTSNVYFAAKYNLNVSGTVAHEWYMGIAAITQNYKQANRIASLKWVQTFGTSLLIALTDTFSTDVFLKSFTANSADDLANVFHGVRQDSGCAEEYIEKVVKHYKSIGVDPSTKVIVHSDALNVDRCIELYKYCEKCGIKSAFGIGTNLTSDFQKVSNPSEVSKPMNIVIKLFSAEGTKAVKISDDIMKNTGDRDAVIQAKHQLCLPIA